MVGRARQWILLWLVAIGLLFSGWQAIQRWVNASRTGWSGLRPAREIRNGQTIYRVGAIPERTPAERAGFQTGDQVLAIDGLALDKVPYRAAIRGHKPGDVLVFRVIRDRQEKDIPVRLQSPLHRPEIIVNQLLNLIAGLVFLGIGSFVFWKRGDDIRGLLFFITCSTFGLGRILWAGPMHNYGMGTADDALVAVFSLGLVFFWFPPLLHFCLVFPRRRPLLERYPGVLGWIYGPSAGTAILLAAIVLIALLPGKPDRLLQTLSESVRPWADLALRYVPLAFVIVAAGAVLLLIRWRRAVRSGGWRKTLLTRPILTLSLAVLLPSGFTLICLTIADLRHLPRHSYDWALAAWGIAIAAVVAALLAIEWLVLPVAACVALFRSYREGDLEQKQQIRWPMWGVIIGIAGFYLAGPLMQIVSRILGLRPESWQSGLTHLLSRNLDAICVMLIPIAFMFAILKYRLMEISIYVRKTLIYGTLTGFLGLMYLVLAGGVGGLVGKYFHIQNDWMLSASTVLVAAAFVPVRNRVQGFVDRRFFHRIDYGAALQSLIRAIAEADGREEVLHRAAEGLQLAMQNRSVACFMRLPGEREFRVTAKVGLPDEVCDRASFRADSAGSFAGAISVPALAELPESEREILRRTCAALVVPIRRRGELLGFFALGKKLSDEGFGAGDTEFLAAAADQVAIALETVRFEEQQHEVERAFEIQKALLPKSLPRVPGLTVAGRWEPARTVSGDYYDVIDLGNGRLALVIADVSGKGIAASLLMSNLQATIKAIAPDCPSPADLAKRVNRIIAGNAARGTFITCFYGVLETTSGKLLYCNAGHNPPLLWRQGAVQKLETGGMVLGLFPIAPYEQDEVTLEPGDRLLLYTDGVSEAANAEDEEFGEERLAALLGAPEAVDAAAIESSVLKAVTAFCNGNFHDDATLIAITVDAAAAAEAK